MTKMHLSLPIDREGQQKISARLSEAGVVLPADFCWDFLTREGKFAKRVKKLAHHQGVKLDDALVAAVGKIAEEHSLLGDLYFDLTCQFDWQAGDFGDEGSCFWGSRAKARELLQKAGAQAIRFYDPASGQGIGRAWVIETQYGTVCFNAYGPISLRKVAKVLALHLGHDPDSVRPVALINEHEAGGLIYINGGSGYLIPVDEGCSQVGCIDLGISTHDPEEPRILMPGADLGKADLAHADLQGADLAGADLQVSNLLGADLSQADLTGANLAGADLRGADLQGAHLQGACLSWADLWGVRLRWAICTEANLEGANLQEANLQWANLQGANLQGADLREANLQGADLSQANLQDADLRGADLREANLQDANLQGALL